MAARLLPFPRSPEFSGSLPVNEDAIYPDWLMAETRVCHIDC